MALTRTKTAVQLLENIAFAYETRFHLIDNHKRQAIQALLYTNTYLAYYRENSAASRQNLYNLLIDVAKNQLPANLSNDTNNGKLDANLLCELVRSLVMVSDLMISQATTPEDHLTSLLEIVRKFPESILKKLACPELGESATLDFLENEGLTITEEKLFRKADKQHAIENLTAKLFFTDLNNIPRKPHQSIEEAMDDYIEQAKSSWHLSQNSTEKAVKDVIKDILILNPADSIESVLLITQYIKKLTEDYPNKEILTACFFSACKDIMLNHHSYTIPLFFPYFESLFPPNRFQELLPSYISLDELIAKIFQQTIDGFGDIDEQAQASLGSLILYITPEQLMENIEKLVTKENYAPVEVFLSHALVHNQFILPFLRAVGPNFVGQLNPDLAAPLNLLPPIFQTEIMEIFKENSLLKKAFVKFVTNLKKVNDSAEVFQQRNITLFFATYQTKVFQIIQSLGIPGIQYLNSKVSQTLLPLERILNQVPTLDDATFSKVSCYSQTYSHFFDEDIQKCDVLLKIMATLKLLIDNTGDHEEVAELFLLAENMNPQEYQQFLIAKVLDYLLPGIKITVEQQQVIFEKVSQDKLFKLLNATRHMRNNTYQEVYLALLKRNLLDEDVDKFLHDVEQDDELGIEIAQHNKKIREQLKNAGVTPEVALSYREKLTLVYHNTDGEKSDIKPQDLYAQLNGHINELFERIKSIKGLGKNAQKNINWLKINIAAISECIENNPTDYFEKHTFQQFYNGLVSRINKLKNNEQLLPRVKEFIEHVSEDITRIKNQTKAQTALKNNYTFHIEQWDKSKLDTFFLGDEVGCCLATTNAEFHAMVQRRQDDAMLFHVAVDQATNKPAALVWLYLAKRSDDQVVLMANFFEVNHHYTKPSHLRLTLLDGLLKFTHQYCKDNPKIAAFYMNKLSYGWNQHDLTNYPTHPIELIDKVGGPFIPGATESDKEDVEDEKEFTTQNYYLASLEEKEFHQYDPKISVFEAPSSSETSMDKSSAVSAAPQAFYYKHQKINSGTTHPPQSSGTNHLQDKLSASDACTNGAASSESRATNLCAKTAPEEKDESQKTDRAHLGHSSTLFHYRQDSTLEIPFKKYMNG